MTGRQGAAHSAGRYVAQPTGHRAFVPTTCRRTLCSTREGTFPSGCPRRGELSAAYPGDPYVPSYIGLRYYRNLQRHDEATDQFRQALERDPGFVQALNRLGHIALDQGDLATAEATFERSVALAPGEPRPHDSLGLLYLRQGRFDDAIRAFEAALAHDARFAESRSNLERARAARAQARAQGEARRVGADGDSDAPRDDQG